jgi:hypothetical protein
VGTSQWGAGRRLRAVPIALALAAAGVTGFLIAQWASRPRERMPASVAIASPAPSAAPLTVPPPTYAAPYVPPVHPSPPAPLRASAPAEAALPDVSPARVAAPTPAPVEPLEPAYALHAVAQRDGEPVAIVNGQLVRVGDVVEGARVVRIDAEAVELEKAGRRIVIGF